MRTKRLPLVIPIDDFKRLCEIGRLEERDPSQQAAYILKQAIREHASAAPQLQAGTLVSAQPEH